MSPKQLRIAQVNAVDTVGGAARIAWTLHQALKRGGNKSWMIVDRKYSGDQDVFRFSSLPPSSNYGRFFYRLAQKLEKIPVRFGTLTIADVFRRFAEPVRYWNRYWGKDDFDHRGTWQLLDLAAHRPDIVHLHNLHSRYFDLRYLPDLSSSIPTLCTLHDTWLLSGHCAYSLDCERWKTGCGHCPYLNVYPAVKHDATAFNWSQKKEIYSRSNLYIATPSQWLLDQVEQSMFAGSVRRSRVIYNGVDLSIFNPGDKQTVRRSLDIPANASVLLFVASSIQNPFKDFPTIQNAIWQLTHLSTQRQLLFLVLGGDGSIRNIGNVEMRSIPYISDPSVVADYYRAADVYIHAARADTFPNVILEALACGTPVVATKVGGIPEQIVDGETGYLTPLGDAEFMAICLNKLLSDKELHNRISFAASENARTNFGLNRMVDEYLHYYDEILEDWQSNQGIADVQG